MTAAADRFECCGSWGVHAITCMTVARECPYAMVDEQGDVYYPDNPDDADHFRDAYGAKPINAAEFEIWYLSARHEEGQPDDDGA